MKITFFSNFLNHHQLPFCLEMYKELGEGFTFVATEPVPEERLKMGYHSMNEQYPFVICSYKNSDSYEQALKLGLESDVVIIGSAPFIFVKERLKQNKVTFYYSERIFKKGRYRILNPKTFYTLYTRHIRYRKNRLYMLCASAYTAADFKIINMYDDKAFKWGYFPEIEEKNLEELMRKKKLNKSLKICWVGRMLNWKHPEQAIEVARGLRSKGYEFELDLIGEGPMIDQIKQMIKKYNLEENVNLLGSISPEEVRHQMEQANLFLFTSDFNEGWGAVLNEAMNSACAVVTSHAIGSVPFLIKNNYNGMIYKSGDVNELYNKVESLFLDPDKSIELGRNAYETMIDEWNPQIAAKRFLSLVKHIEQGNLESGLFSSGPCSKAEVISQKYRD